MEEKRKYKVEKVDKSGISKARLGIAVDSILLSAGVGLAYTSIALGYSEYVASQFFNTFLSWSGGVLGGITTLTSSVGFIQNAKEACRIKRKK